jgi:hypothetical protein
LDAAGCRDSFNVSAAAQFQQAACINCCRDARSLQADGELLPSVLHDPYAIASLLHGALRAYVAISGMLQAYNIYKSIKVHYHGSCHTSVVALV